MSYILLAAGVFAITSLVAYLTWEKIRLLRFRSDLLRIRSDLQKKAESLGCLDDQEYRSVSRFLERHEFVSWSWLAAIYLTDPHLDVTLPRTTNVKLRAVLDQAKEARAWRDTAHILYETGAGCLIRMIVAIMPRLLKPRAERKTKRTVKHYCERVDTVGFRAWQAT